MNNKSAYRARLLRAIARETSGKRFGGLDALYLVVVFFVLYAVVRPVPAAILSMVQKDAVQSVRAQEPVSTIAPKAVEKPTDDPRIKRIRSYLVEKKSPLAEYADLIVSEADRYDIGWTKVVAISGMESGYGINVREGSHNAWGIGGSKLYVFASWEEGIREASKLLGDHYKDNEYQAIKAKYCPASDNCNPKWAANVTQFSRDILAMNEE